MAGLTRSRGYARVRMPHRSSFGGQRSGSNAGPCRRGQPSSDGSKRSSSKRRAPAADRATAASNSPRGRVCAQLAELAERRGDAAVLAVDFDGLSPRDAAFARALYRSAVTRWLTIGHVAGRFTRQPWHQLDPPTTAAIAAGTAQLLFLGGVAPHAAVNESVAWIKRVQPRSSGIVNAVLRRVAECVQRTDDGQVVRRDRWLLGRDELPLPSGQSLVLAQPLLPDGLAQRLEAATGIPRWQVERWLEAPHPEADELATSVRDKLAADGGPSLEVPEARAVAWCLHSLSEAPVVMRVAGSATAALTELQAHDEPGHAVLIEPPAALDVWLKEHPDLWVQDASSSRAIADNSTLKPAVIFDVCAGQGTKTRQLLATFPEARVVATDTDDHRRRTLKRTLGEHDRLTIVEPADLAQAVLECGKADLILADVPCSNSGVLARRAEARLRLGPQQLKRLVATQREIIARAVQMLAPGGAMLYATCSLDPEENRQQATWAERSLGLRVERDRLSTPAGGPGHPATAYRDGAYWALLRSL